MTSQYHFTRLKNILGDKSTFRRKLGVSHLSLYLDKSSLICFSADFQLISGDEILLACHDLTMSPEGVGTSVIL